ncbi:hypothetical protein CEXT_167091 [Caerostris extrusa]|uniref:Non-specific serine/threonine protein kinase n=1 Tax=Caerostris extrusa TaxID=172846 RepID=A0AAV4T3X5_CAEEX|nr:hypothetical protein CEXT_167091 [Caerostris extrusa]
MVLKGEDGEGFHKSSRSLNFPSNVVSFFSAWANFFAKTFRESWLFLSCDEFVLLFWKRDYPCCDISAEITPELEKVFKFCNVKSNVKFAEALLFWKQRSARKISEGSYGEIYQFKHVDGTDRVFKCVPVNGQHPMSSYLEYSSRNVSNRHSLLEIRKYKFRNSFHSICLVRDHFPECLVRAWWDYRSSLERLKDPAEHHQPDQYPESQLYLTIESSFCGEPLTMRMLQNAWLGVSIMSQITAALAVAEAAYNFEHRDIHLGNILVRSTNAVSLKYTIHNHHFSIETVGYHVFIIDFTLSRIYCDQNVYCVGLDEIARQSNENKEVSDCIWLNHKNIYKIMAEYSKREWDKYMPITNIIWLKYMNENILDYLQKNNPQFMKLVPPNNEHNQMKAINLLRKWNDCILQHKSAMDLLNNTILEITLLFACMNDTS